MDFSQIREGVPGPFSRNGRQLYRLHGPEMVVGSQVRTEEPSERKLPVLFQAAVETIQN